VPRLVLINPVNPVSLYGEYRWQPLSLAVIAAATPPEWEVVIHDEAVDGPVDPEQVRAELVGLTAFTSQAPRAYALAAALRARGVVVAMGGIHATMCPDEALAHVDVVVLREGEGAWPTVCADVLAGRAQRRYDGGLADLGRAIRPARHLLHPGAYDYVSAQTTRGCPMACTFCSVTAFNGRLFRMRDVEDVVAELAELPAGDLILVDDDLNGFSRAARKRCEDLFRAMIAAGLRHQWVTQVTINFGDDEALPRLAHAAGCRGVFIGLEATDTASLSTIRKDGRSRRRGLELYRENVARIRAAGVGVTGSFILGIDGQDVDRAPAEILAFAEETHLDGLNPTILTPLPGTDDFARMDRDGRILFRDWPEDWAKYTLSFPVTSFPNTTGANLMRRWFEVLQFFRPEHVEGVRARTARELGDEAARHAWLWNRTWTTFGERHGRFRRRAP
jgi:radical SAM superfamily enzyme YgiQ (UPF0313 family)